jgi:hypothetical protein
MSEFGFKDYSPLAIFACRRPDHLRNLLGSLQLNPLLEVTPLFFFIGGPKSESDWPKVEESIKIAKEFKSSAKVKVIESFQERTGSGLIRSGVNRVLKEFDRVIVLEDDLEVRQDFLLYMNSSLRHFELDDDISSVSAWNFGISQSKKPETTYLFPATTSWGWATWKRAWPFEINIEDDYRWLIQKSSRIHKFNFHENYNCLRMIERIVEEDYDAWDAAWYLYCFRRSKLTVFPNSSLIINRGFDGTGLNFRRSYSWKSSFDEEAQESFLFPSKLEISPEFKIYRRNIRNWSQTFWPDSDFKFFVDQLKRKRRQHLNYYKRGFYK